VNILFVGINYAPEPTGIAIYTSGLARALVDAGHGVTILCAPPHFPTWTVKEGYSRARYRTTIEDGVRVIRCPTYIPSSVSGKKRILHYLSFAISSALAGAALRKSFRPDVVFAVAPSLLSARSAHAIARWSRAKSWLHIQDFEVEAALATSVLRPSGRLARMAERFERRMVRKFGKVSSISSQMCAKLRQKGVPPERIEEFRNWADLKSITPLDGPSAYRTEWNIETSHVALYSGSIGNKQGIEIIIDAARILQDRTDLCFVICGEGPNKSRLVALADGLTNIQFRDLQPAARLRELMGLATVHLLPQIEGAADLVLPSKMANMLASGRPVVATAAPGTGIANALEGCGSITPPGDPQAFAAAITCLLDDPGYRANAGTSARARAKAIWDKERILDSICRQLESFGRTTNRNRDHLRGF
jgi:colanic acid biosynthesis glycosyl transferase WcaI